METISQRQAALAQRHPQWKPMILSAYFDHIAAAYPERPHVITGDHAYTYAEIQAWSRRLARGLLACGVQLGEHIAIVMTNCPDFVALKYAIARIGAVAVPLNYLYRAEELGYVLQQSESVLLVTIESYRDINFLESLDMLAPGWEQHGGGAALPSLRRVVTVSDCREGVASLHGLEALGERISDAELAAREQAGQPDALADIVYTSGTTGQPKGAMLTHDMVLRSAYGSALTRAYGDGWRVLYSLPLYHVFGYIEGLMAALCVGGAVIPQPVFDPDAALRDAERYHVNEMLFVPTMAIAIAERAARKHYDLSSLESIFMAAAPAPVRIWEQLRDLLGLKQVYTGFGATEESAATTLTFPNDPLDLVSTTVGRPKLAGVAGLPQLGGALVEDKTIDPFSQQDLPPGAQGELMVRGVTVTRGYYGKPEETAATIEPDGWLHTGDLGRVRSDGYLELTGRSKDVYKCGGEMVAPKEVEDVINRLPEVVQAYVIGLPHRRLGEIGCAWVVPAEGARIDRREVVRQCRRHLARFKVPRYVFVVAAADLPTTSTGKVQKFRLIERAMRELGIAPRTDIATAIATPQQLPQAGTTAAIGTPAEALLASEEADAVMRSGAAQKS